MYTRGRDHLHPVSNPHKLHLCINPPQLAFLLRRVGSNHSTLMCPGNVQGNVQPGGVRYAMGVAEVRGSAS